MLPRVEFYISDVPYTLLILDDGHSSSGAG